MMSTKQGEGKNEESNIVRANVILALLASSIVVTILFLILLTPLLKLMGAEGELLRLSQIYGRVMHAHRRRASDLILWTDTSSSK